MMRSSSLTVVHYTLQAINKLMEAELSLCSELEMGVETYIRPLKFIIPEDSHQKIFLGIPEVI